MALIAVSVVIRLECCFLDKLRGDADRDRNGHRRGLIVATNTLGLKKYSNESYSCIVLVSVAG